MRTKEDVRTTIIKYHKNDNGTDDSASGGDGDSDNMLYYDKNNDYDHLRAMPMVIKMSMKMA